MEVSRRQPNEIRKGSITVNDPQDRSISAMGTQTRKAKITTPADNIDLADDALPDQISLGGMFHDADKLVPQRPFEPHVSAGDFQIRGANTGLRDPDGSVAA